MTAARFYRCGRMTTGRLGHAPTLGRVRIGLNMIHGPMGQNKVSHHCWQKKVSALKSKIMIVAGSDMIWT
jgi:hypothetical protein